jgi:hypothetical protein
VIEAGTGKPTSVVDAAKDVIAATQSDSPIIFREMRPGEPPDTTVVAQAPACSVPWPYGLDETIDYYRRLLR